MSSRIPMTISAEPLRAAIGRWIAEGQQIGETWRSYAELAEWAGLTERQIKRIMIGAHERVQVRHADRISLAMHTHPAIVWPDEWLDVPGVSFEEAG